MIEEVTVFGTPPLAGVFSHPSAGNRNPEVGVVLLSPGLLHRVGPNRTYVNLARALATDGFEVLRFDFSGQGESPPRIDHLPHRQSKVAESRAAIDHLVSQTGCSKVILIGHCSGGAFATLTAFEEERVAGIVSISPRDVNADWEEFDRRQKEARYYSNYYTRSTLTDSGRWRRLLTGQVDYTSIARNVFRGIIWYRISTLAYRLQVATGMAARRAEERYEIAEFKERLQSLTERRVPMMLIHPDQSAERELIRATLGGMVDQMREAGHLEVAYITESDHIFTPLAAQRDLIETIRGWIRDNGWVSAGQATGLGSQVERATTGAVAGD